MTMTMRIEIKKNVTGLVSRELSSLTPQEIDDFFEKSKKWDLSHTLSNGGSAIFPHTVIRTCGDQLAAVVRGCLDACRITGKRHVIALGVLHPHGQPPLAEARQKALRGEDVSDDSCRGIFGPHFIADDKIWANEYSLLNFMHFWDIEIERRQLKNPPELIVAYPSLLNDKPWELPGIEELQSYLPDSIVVATTDFCHHGVAYGVPQEEAVPISKEAELLSLKILQEGLELFEKINYADFLQYCQRTVCDGADVGQVLMYLKGPMKAKILDTRLIDTSALYETDPQPSWVAVTLIEMNCFKVVN